MHSPTEAMRAYDRYRASMAAARSGTNHASQIEVVCVQCGETFDVGRERLRSPLFEPWCYTCWLQWKAAS